MNEKPNKLELNKKRRITLLTLCGIFTLLGLVAGTVSYFSLVANAAGTTPQLTASPVIINNQVTQVNLNWSQFDSSTTNYEIWQSQDSSPYSLLTTTQTLSYTDPMTSTDQDRTFSYYVIGYDGSGVQTGISNTVSVITDPPPLVETVSPSNGAVVKSSQTGSDVIKIAFNQPINQATLTTGVTVTTTPAGGTASGTTAATIISYDTNTNTATVSVGSSPAPFTPNTIYTVDVSTGVQSSKGVGFVQPYIWSFRTVETSGTTPHGNYDVATEQCSMCHSAHTAQTTNLITKASVADTCDICHNGTQAPSGGTLAPQGPSVDYAGASNFNLVGHGAFGLSCQDCHDSHSSNLTNRLLVNGGSASQYVTQLTTPDSITYNPNNFTACTSSGCHPEFADSAYYPSKQPLPQGNISTNTNSTNFFDTTYGDLHYLHLVQAGLDNNPATGQPYGNAVCFDCHRPHGAISSDNEVVSTTTPTIAGMVGFPSAAVLPEDSIPPVFSVSNGANACTLNCHGYLHKSLSYTP